jgi:hypothetical protein
MEATYLVVLILTCVAITAMSLVVVAKLLAGGR